MFGLIKEVFIVLLTGLVNGSNHTKCISLSNQKCVIRPALINLLFNELNYYLRLKYKRVQYDYRNKWIQDINKAYIPACKYWSPGCPKNVPLQRS